MRVLHTKLKTFLISNNETFYNKFFIPKPNWNNPMSTNLINRTDSKLLRHRIKWLYSPLPKIHPLKISVYSQFSFNKNEYVAIYFSIFNRHKKNLDYFQFKQIQIEQNWPFFLLCLSLSLLSFWIFPFVLLL